MKLPIKGDKEMEALSGIVFETCAAYFDGDSRIRILGEAKTANGKSLQEYREVQVVVYDSDGDIIGRGYTNWGSFQIRQSFEIEIEDLPTAPAKIRVFPSGSE